MLKAGEVRKTLSGWRYGTLGGKDIVTIYCFPPIPVRHWDWCAYHDGEEEKHQLYGWGETEQKALADMRRIDQEVWEGEHEQEIESD